MRTQPLDINQLIEIATALVLQRKKLPSEDMCEIIEFHSSYLLCSISE
jgi:hypothetical protein